MEQAPPDDPFPTSRIAVPHLGELLKRVRGATAHSITIVHARREGEGDWILGTAAARLRRSSLKIAGPEPMLPKDMVEYALRTNSKVVLAGEIRREDDARALRHAAALGLAAVGVITTDKLSEAKTRLAFLGPWTNYDVALLSESE
jgi:hypothetical protein